MKSTGRHQAIAAGACLLVLYGGNAMSAQGREQASVQGSCFETWSPSRTYAKPGHRVTLGGRNYENKWWTQGGSPAKSGKWGVWRDLGVCSSQPPLVVSVVQPPKPMPPTAVKPVSAPGKKSATPAATAVIAERAPTSTAAGVSGGREVGGYFTQWSIYGRNYKVRDIDVSGSAKKLTFLNYAFGNLYPKNGGYECGIVNKAEPGASDPNHPQAGTGGDSWADYQKGFTASESVNGTSDPWGLAWNDPRTGKSGLLKGNFNQIKQLKARHPHLKVMISLGGWTWSKWFGKAASTDALRRQLVSSCIDVYIKGNLPFDASSNAGGEGVGEGVFDGIDVDWEFPGGGGQPYNIVDSGDKRNFTLLLEEFRRQLDAIGTTKGKRYLLTVAIGAGGDKIENTEPAEYSKPLDWINVMTYDYHGGWESTGPTDFASNLFPDPASPSMKSARVATYNGDTAVRKLLASGVPASKIVVGIPFYGRGWTGVSPGPRGDGLYQAAARPAPGKYEAGVNDYKILRNEPGVVYEHPITKQSYKFDGTTFWSYDTPTTVRTKVDYAKQHSLRGVFTWALDGDTADAELLGLMGEFRR